MLPVVESPDKHHRFAEPTPLGLLGLAIGCASLTPIAFGFALTPAGLKTAAMFCLLFGGGCQLLAGLMGFANKNVFGGTVLTTFSFNWAMNWWALTEIANGRAPDHTILLATDAVSLLLFLVITYGFGYYSKLLFWFLVDIDVLYAAKLVKALGGGHAMDLPIALCTVLLGLVALWIAFAMLVNPAAGRTVFPVPGPMFAAAQKKGFDFARRTAIFAVLYERFEARAFEPLAVDELATEVAKRDAKGSIASDLAYLEEKGALVATRDASGRATHVRLAAAGIDVYERAVLGRGPANAESV